VRNLSSLKPECVLQCDVRHGIILRRETFEAELGFLRDSDPITDKQQEKREVVDNGERKALPAPCSREDGSKSDDNAQGTSSEEQAQNKQQEVEVSQMWAMEHIKSLPSNQQQQLIAAALSMAGHTSQNADESKNTSEDAQQENKRSREEHDSDSTPKKAAKTS
jgi:ribosomal protein L12E/L44/L45/RPP1/RPP2